VKTQKFLDLRQILTNIWTRRRMGLWLVLLVWKWMTNIRKRTRLRDVWWLMLLVRKFLGRRLTSKLKVILILAILFLILDDEEAKISGSEANTENKIEGPLVDSPHLETLGEVTDRSIKGYTYILIFSIFIFNFRGRRLKNFWHRSK